MNSITDALADEQALETRFIDEVPDTHLPLQQGYSHILQQFIWMGWSAFGGPSAHIGLFQQVSWGNLKPEKAFKHRTLQSSAYDST